MKEQTILKGLIIGVCVLSLAGCGTKQAEIQGEKDMSVTGQYQNDIPGTEDTSLNRDDKDSAAPETNDANGNGNGNTEQPMPNKDDSAEKRIFIILINFCSQHGEISPMVKVKM